MTLSKFLKKVGGKESDIIEYVTEVDALAAVKNDGDALRYVAESNQTEAVCLAAVKNDGFALQYVAESKRTEAVCLAAVKNNSYALQYVSKKVFE